MREAGPASMAKSRLGTHEPNTATFHAMHAADTRAGRQRPRTDFPFAH